MKRLQEYMRRHNMTIEELAKHLGYGYPTVYSWVSGWRTPSLKLAIDIEKKTKGFVKCKDWEK